MKQYDCHGKKIDYDAPGQIGRFSPKPEKLPRVDRFRQQLDALRAYYDGRGETERPMHVTLGQLRQLCKVNPDDLTWKPSGNEKYYEHPLIVTEEP